MRITTRLTLDIETGNVLEHAWYEYEGPLMLLGGGPSSQQKQAADQSLQNAQQENANAQNDTAIQNKIYGTVSPFATGLMQNGDPTYASQMDAAGGDAAQAAAPGRAQLARSLSSMGSLPSGFATSQMAQYNENAANAYDQNLQNVQQNNLNAKLQGANVLNGQESTFNPNAAYQTSNQASNSIANDSSLQGPSYLGVLGGIAGGALNTGINAYATRSQNQGRSGSTIPY